MDVVQTFILYCFLGAAKLVLRAARFLFILCIQMAQAQVRKYLKYTWRHRLRRIMAGISLGSIGTYVNIDENVKFLRFPRNIYLGDDVILKEGARLCSCNPEAKIIIGDRTTIGYHSFLFSSHSITIGSDCLIAPFVYIVDSNHSISRKEFINRQPNVTAPIIIKEDVWIASNVTILKGVTISKGAVIAANSVVNCDIGEYEIWGGSPAKKIGLRQ